MHTAPVYTLMIVPPFHSKDNPCSQQIRQSRHPGKQILTGARR